MTEDHKKLSRYYLLSLISNINSGFAPKNEDELHGNIKKIGECLDKINDPEIGEWDVLWGPCVITSPVTIHRETRHVTDNAMYVAKLKNEETYFIGISGTNGQSRVGWFDEDFDVKKMLPWKDVNKDAKISRGAHTGLQKLLGMSEKLTDGHAGKERNLMSFLSTEVITKENPTVAIGGHSLGGCLAPVLAAEIASQLKGSGLSIEVYPTAGPTPGNTAFANHLVSVVTKYHAVNNENDLVPLAWNFDGLDALLKNYGQWKFGRSKINPESPLLKLWMNWARQYVSDEDYQRVPSIRTDNFKVDTWPNKLIPDVMVKGKVKTNSAIYLFTKMILNSPSVKKQMKRIYSGSKFHVLQDFGRFLLQVGMQHVPAYSNSQSQTGSIAPIQVSEELRKEIAPFFKKGSSASNGWKKNLAIKLFTELSEKVADWYQEHSEHRLSELDEAELVAFETNAKQSEEELVLEQQLDEIMAIENEEEQEKALEALGIDLDLLPWNWNPLTF